MFFPRRPHYFSYAVNREVKELYWQAVISNLAMTSTVIFEPLFLYSLHYSLIQILWFYVLVYIGYAVFVFPAAKITSRIGYKHSIFLGTIFYLLYWAVLYQIRFHPNLFVVAPLFFGLQKSFFWPSYNADVAVNAAKKQEGREVGVLFSLIEAASIGGPILGGIISSGFGFSSLFVISGLLMLFSTYPLFRSDEIYTKHKFYFRNFWQIVRQYPQNFFGYWGYAEDLMLMSLWPIFMFMVVPQLFNIGLITTVASLIAIVLMLYVGKLSDKLNPVTLIKTGSVFYGITWFIRAIGVGFGSIFALDVLTRLGKAWLNVPMIALTYEIAGKKTTDYAIAYSVFYEFSLAIGKILTALVGIWILSTTGNIYYVFIFAGGFTFLYSLLRK